MKKTGVLTAALFFGFVCVACSQDFKKTFAQEVPLSPPAPALKVGEILEYSVEWLGMPVGNMVLKVADIATVNNHQCYHIIARSFPNRFIRKLYDLEYKVHTYLDVRSLSTRRFIKIRRINRKFNYVIFNFYPERHAVSYRTWGTSEFVNFSRRPRPATAETPDTYIPDGTQDLLSSFFYFRLLKVASGETYKMNVYYGNQNWPVAITVSTPFLKEMHKKGAIAAVETQITSDLNDFILGKRKFLTYLTADSRRIPLEFKVGTAMGLIRGVIKYLPE